MRCYSIGIMYVDDEENIIEEKSYRIVAENITDLLDKALNYFWEDTSYTFDNDIEHIEWSFCPV